MAKSIIQSTDSLARCYICGSYKFLEEHHIFGGNGKRPLSEKYGLKVYLCHNCHNEPPNGVHHNKINREALQAKAQQIAMEHYKWDIPQFIKIFGRNYL